MSKAGAERLADYDEGLFDLKTLDYEQETRKVAVTVDLPSEFQALLSGLSSDGGRDQNGKITKLWKINGIQSIDFLQCEPGKTIVFNLDGTTDESKVYLELTDWLADLRVRRQFTEQLIARSVIKS